MARLEKLPGCNYEGMIPSKWPSIRPADESLYLRLVAALNSGNGWSPRERAQAHRWIHYLLSK
jgi:hypothetical protein